MDFIGYFDPKIKKFKEKWVLKINILVIKFYFMLYNIIISFFNFNIFYKIININSKIDIIL
jgi:hypothetical protein